MKKLFLTSAICLLLSIGSNAQQNYRHEVRLSAGLWASEYAAVEGYANLLVMFLLRETIKPYQRSNGLYGTYRYRISRRFSAGVTAGATLLNTDESLFGYSPESGDYRYISALFAAEAQFHYFDGPIWCLYSMAGGGVGNAFERNSAAASGVVEKSRSPLMIMQISPIGIRCGKTVGIFAELGYGYKGILNTGISVRF